MSKIQSILFLVFPNVGEQDLLAPWELLRALAWSKAQKGEALEVTLGTFEKSGMVTTQMGAKLADLRTLSPADRFDVVYVPGGIGAGAMSKDPVVLDFLRAHQAEQRWLAANCAGLGVLHRAGVLDGIEVTTPATLARRLPREGTRVVSPRRAWKIDAARKVFTSGGAATVHPSTIALVAQLFGEADARALASAWDTQALHGDALYAAEGPIMTALPTDAALQDVWEGVFLP
jgi:transcriptional regulator GlxA family with amidase domain